MWSTHGPRARVDQRTNHARDRSIARSPVTKQARMQDRSTASEMQASKPWSANQLRSVCVFRAHLESALKSLTLAVSGYPFRWCVRCLAQGGTCALSPRIHFMAVTPRRRDQHRGCLCFVPWTRGGTRVWRVATGNYEGSLVQRPRLPLSLCFSVSAAHTDRLCAVPHLRRAAALCISGRWTRSSGQW